MDDLDIGEKIDVAEKMVEKAQQLGISEKKMYLQVNAWGKLQAAMEELDVDTIDETVEIISEWRELTGANNIDGILTEEEIRENLELAAEMQEQFNIPGRQDADHVLMIENPKGFPDTIQNDLERAKQKDDAPEQAPKCRIAYRGEEDRVEITAEDRDSLKWLYTWLEESAQHYRREYQDAVAEEEAARQMARKIYNYKEKLGEEDAEG